MIEQLEGFPPGVVAFAGSGRVTGADYREVLEPALDAALKAPGRIRLYYRVDDFDGFDAGAMWEDAKIGLEHWNRWERVAVVTDVDWISQSVKAFRFMMPAEVRTFALAEDGEARGWLAEGKGA